jgi:hypothetical protein
MAKRRGVVGEFFVFLRQHKAYWLIPIIVVLLLLVLLVIFTGAGGAIAPFIYAI